MGEGQSLQMALGSHKLKNETGPMYTIINSKQMKDLNIRPKAMKLLEEHIGSKFLDKGLGDDFLKI